MNKGLKRLQEKDDKWMLLTEDKQNINNKVWANFYWRTYNLLRDVSSLNAKYGKTEDRPDPNNQIEEDPNEEIKEDHHQLRDNESIIDPMAGIRRPVDMYDDEEADETEEQTSPLGKKMIPEADSSNTDSITESDEEDLMDLLLKQYDSFKRQKKFHTK